MYKPCSPKFNPPRPPPPTSSPPFIPHFALQDLVTNVYNAARAPTRPQFDSFMRRVQELKPATYAHLMNVLPLSSWTHHACKQDTRIGDTVTSNNAESVFNMIGEEVRFLWSTAVLSF